MNTITNTYTYECDAKVEFSSDMGHLDIIISTNDKDIEKKLKEIKQNLFTFAKDYTAYTVKASPPYSIMCYKPLIKGKTVYLNMGSYKAKINMEYR